MSATSTQSSFRHGVRDGLPFLLVGIPFGMMFGIVGVEAGLNLSQVLGFSVVVIAGAAQFAAVQLMVDNAPTLVILGTALAVNLRMAMYSASLTPYLGRAPLGRRIFIAYFLVDQAYALSIARFESDPWLNLGQRIAYYSGVVLSFCPFWYVATWIGAVVGEKIPAEYGLDFAMPVVFLAMIGPMLRTVAHLAAALTSIVVALGLAVLPYNVGLLAAALAAMAVGAEIERRRAA